MTKVKKPHRNAENILSDEEIKFFYTEILLYSECDRTYWGAFEKVKKQIKATDSLKNFDFVYINYEEKMKNPKPNVFYFNPEKELEEEKRTRRSKILERLFAHIRNAFAHNYIRNEENGVFVLEDFYSDYSKQTLYVRITSMESFMEIMRKIKDIIAEQEKENKEKHGQN